MRPACFLLIGALALPFSDRPAVAQAPPRRPSFGTGVEVVTVDVVVLDRAGRPIPDLTRDDFVIEEEGRSQEIVNFESFVAEPAPEVSATTGVVATNEAFVPTNGRAFVLLLDDFGMTPARAAQARRAAQTFLLRSVRDGDFVTLGTSSGEYWWSARLPEGREDLEAVISRVQGRRVEENAAFGRMSEYEAFYIAHYENLPPLGGSGARPSDRSGVPPPEGGVAGSVKERVRKRWQDDNVCAPVACDGMIRARATEINGSRAARLRLVEQSLFRGLDALSPVRGRKSLLLFSEGFMQENESGLRGVAAASREVNAAIYFVDARGMVALGASGQASDAEKLELASDAGRVRFEQANLESAGSQELASETGGFSVRNTNDLESGAARIANESRVFYLLGFGAPPGRGPGQWRKISVRVKKEGLTVRARRGYMLRAAAPTAAVTPSGGKLLLDRGVSGALDSARDAAGIPLRAMAYVLEPREKGTHLLVGVELDSASLAFAPKGAGRTARIALSVVATHRESGRTLRHDDLVQIEVPEGQQPGWRAVTRELELPPGIVQVRVVARDLGGESMGAVTQRVEVPLPSGLHLSTPVLTDRLEPPTEAAGRPRPALAVHRTFAPQGRLFCQYEVFGAVSPGEGSPPRVRAGFSLRSAAGRVLQLAEPTPIAADADGRLVRMVGVGLDGLEDGAYEVVLDVQDEVSGQRAERIEPFTLSRVAS